MTAACSRKLRAPDRHLGARRTRCRPRVVGHSFRDTWSSPSVRRTVFRRACGGQRMSPPTSRTRPPDQVDAIAEVVRAAVALLSRLQHRPHCSLIAVVAVDEVAIGCPQASPRSKPVGDSCDADALRPRSVVREAGSSALHHLVVGEQRTRRAAGDPTTIPGTPRRRHRRRATGRSERSRRRFHRPSRGSPWRTAPQFPLRR